MGEGSEVILGETLGAAHVIHMSQNEMRNERALFVLSQTMWYYRPVIQTCDTDLYQHHPPTGSTGT